MVGNYLKFMEDKEYRDLPYPSYSLLKELEEKGPSILLGSPKKASKALSFGSMVDVLLTEPEKKDEIYYTKPLPQVSDTIKKIADTLIIEIIMMGKSKEVALSDENILKVMDTLGIYSSFKDDTKLNKINESPLFDYIDIKLDCGERETVDVETMEKAEHTANILKTSDVTKDIFIKQNDNIEIFYQPIVIFKLKNCKIKVKLDVVRVDNVCKIIDIYDIKTGTVIPSQFIHNFYRFKYWLQAIIQTLAIEHVVMQIERDTAKEMMYKTNSFGFIYASKSMPNNPCIINVPFKFLTQFTDSWYYGEEKKKGLMELIDDYVFYTNSGIFDCERIVIENNGKLNITDL